MAAQGTTGGDLDLVAMERSAAFHTTADRKGRIAVIDRHGKGMDSTAGSGHRPTVAVGTPIYSCENRAG